MSAVDIARRDDGVAVLALDVPGQEVNTLTPGVLDELERHALDLLSDDGVVALVLASGKPRGFLAGADLHVLEEIGDAEQAAALARRGQAALSRLAGAGKPVVAAVHGAALGGGLEVALACSYILASDDPATVLGLPEVQLGLLPAAGGTQRLPRRIGLTAALPLLLTGKRVRPRRALRLGLVDAVTTPGGIHDTAARIAGALARGARRAPKRKRALAARAADSALARGAVLRRARAEVERTTRGLYPAPPHILECVETGLREGMDAGLACEARRFGELVVSRESRALVRLFHWKNGLARETTGAAPRPVGRIAVLGAGFMGAGIASVSLARHPVVLRDVSRNALGNAARIVHEGLQSQRRAESISAVESDRRWWRLHLTTDADALAGSDLVVEAVFEDLELKRRVLAEAEERIAPDAVFASNTSALPIAEIARDARHPERVVGMHYFSPVPKMPLLEIVAAERSADWAIETARRVGIAQGKTVIVVRDGPGFYTSRILAVLLEEAMALLAERARVEDVDGAMRDFGFPVGPLALLDEVGIDVAAHVSRDLAGRVAPERAEAGSALGRLLEAGYEGRKNRRGFYEYPTRKKGKSKRVNAEVYELFGGPHRAELPRAVIQDRLVLRMVNEAVTCLAESVLAAPRDGDVGAVFGLGFPPRLGGPFRSVDERGAAEVAARLEQLRDAHGARFAPCPLLEQHARGNRRFHP